MTDVEAEHTGTICTQLHTHPAPSAVPTVNLRCRPLPLLPCQIPGDVQPPPRYIHQRQPDSGTGDNLAFNNRAAVITFTGPSVHLVHLS